MSYSRMNRTFNYYRYENAYKSYSTELLKDQLCQTDNAIKQHEETDRNAQSLLFQRNMRIIAEAELDRRISQLDGAIDGNDLTPLQKSYKSGMVGFKA